MEWKREWVVSGHDPQSDLSFVAELRAICNRHGAAVVEATEDPHDLRFVWVAVGNADKLILEVRVA